MKPLSYAHIVGTFACVVAGIIISILLGPKALMWFDPSDIVLVFILGFGINCLSDTPSTSASFRSSFRSAGVTLTIIGLVQILANMSSFTHISEVTPAFAVSLISIVYGILYGEIAIFIKKIRSKDIVEENATLSA
jgi:flagellar motor component MotA